MCLICRACGGGRPKCVLYVACGRGRPKGVLYVELVGEVG